MPNIEIHGIQGSGASKIRERIEALVHDLPFAGDVAITVCNTDVRDVAGVPCTPHLRICLTDMGMLPSLLESLEPLRKIHIGFEVVKLEQWIPPLV